MNLWRVIFWPLDQIDSLLWRRWYGREVKFFQDLQTEIELEFIEMGLRWAAIDHDRSRSGLPVQGLPRGTPTRTAAVYREALSRLRAFDSLWIDARSRHLDPVGEEVFIDVR